MNDPKRDLSADASKTDRGGSQQPKEKKLPGSNVAKRTRGGPKTAVDCLFRKYEDIQKQCVASNAKVREIEESSLKADIFYHIKQLEQIGPLGAVQRMSYTPTLLIEPAYVTELALLRQDPREIIFDYKDSFHFVFARKYPEKNKKDDHVMGMGRSPYLAMKCLLRVIDDMISENSESDIKRVKAVQLYSCWNGRWPFPNFRWHLWKFWEIKQGHSRCRTLGESKEFAIYHIMRT